MFTFLIQVAGCLTGTVGGIFLFVYLFLDHDNKQYKKNGITLLVVGWAVAILAFVIDFLLN